MKPLPPTGALNRSANVVAYPPAAQLEEYAACPLLIARSEPIPDASLPAILARSNPGMAIAAMMPMIATTISNSMRVKPFAFRIFITRSSKEKVVRTFYNWTAGCSDDQEQRQCHRSSVCDYWR